MKKRLEWALVAAILAAATIGAASAKAEDRLSLLTRESAGMIVGRSTAPPLGYVRFCETEPAECGARDGHAGKVVLNADDLRQLAEVNDAVNGSVKPMTDIDHYGEIERWTYPQDGYGDCEDYVLQKRRNLIALGWPAETLLITVVRDTNGDGHSVLTVVTDRGDLVLDNQEPDIRSWIETEYRYVKRQSQQNPDNWVSLGDARAPATVGRN